jgi:ribose-phosphate pyrophosphokinase
VDHLYASSVFVPYLKELNLSDMVIAAPDAGGVKRANAYSKFLQTPLVICHKFRVQANEVDEIRIIGDVKGKNVVLVDDIIDTAGTITLAAEKMKQAGAKSVRAVISHPVLSGPAYERIEHSALDELIVTDSIPLKKESPKIKVLSIAKLFADVIEKVFNNQSISENFIQK